MLLPKSACAVADDVPKLTLKELQLLAVIVTAVFVLPRRRSAQLSAASGRVPPPFPPISFPPLADASVPRHGIIVTIISAVLAGTSQLSPAAAAAVPRSGVIVAIIRRARRHPRLRSRRRACWKSPATRR